VPTSPFYNDNQLLHLVAQDDAKAFRHLFLAHYDLIYSTSLLYIKVHELAEDVVQQVFLKVWEKREMLPAIEKFDDWLFIITRNEVINVLRKQSSLRHYLRHMQDLFEAEAGGEGPEEQLIVKQQRAIIQLAVKKLPPQQQQAYRLSRDRGMSYEEIATDMGLSINTVKGHISTALRSIREFLRHYRDELTLLLLAGLLR
jgi:RNA polymerase sigma-70 factor (ECF subfamily)